MSDSASTSATVLHGIDFSGAAGGGRAKIRHAVIEDGRARVRALDRTALRMAILAAREDGREHLWRIDAPFSMPIASIERHGLDSIVRDGVPQPHAWLQLARWMHAFGDARQWRRALRAVDRKEPRRVTDREARTPLAPVNLRDFKQTWSIVCEVLLPLAEAGVHIDPVHATGDRVRVCEACPASMLLACGESPRGYKGPGEPTRLRRSELIEFVRSRGIGIDPSLAAEAIDDHEGDVLDALLLLIPGPATVVPREALVEAWVG